MILEILILLFDFGISIWNAYASGYNIGMLKKQGSYSDLMMAGSYAGLGLAFAGMTYVVAYVLAYFGYYMGYVSYSTYIFTASLDFLVFGLMIIGFGLVVTIQSIAVAIKKRSLGSIFIALYNTAAEIFDIAMYAESFKSSVAAVNGNREGERSGTEILIVAVLISFIIVHAAYKHGLAKSGYVQSRGIKDLYGESI